MVPLFGAAYATPNKVTTIFFTDLGLQKTVLNPLANGKIQGFFKAFECSSSTFQGKFYFQGLFKTVLYTKLLFKPVRTLRHLSHSSYIEHKIVNIFLTIILTSVLCTEKTISLRRFL